MFFEITAVIYYPTPKSPRIFWWKFSLDIMHLKCIIFTKKAIMSQIYIRLSLEPVLKKAISEFPAVVLTGPRQSGKTTLLHYFYKE